MALQRREVNAKIVSFSGAGLWRSFPLTDGEGSLGRKVEIASAIRDMTDETEKPTALIVEITRLN